MSEKENEILFIQTPKLLMGFLSHFIGKLSSYSVFAQIGQVVAALFATELFHVHFRAKSSGIQDRVKFEISTHFSVPKLKK